VQQKKKKSPHQSHFTIAQIQLTNEVEKEILNYNTHIR